MKHILVYILVAGFTLGVLVRSFIPASDSATLGGVFSFSLFLIFLSTAIAFLYYIKKGKDKNIVLAILFIFAAGLGVLRFDVAYLNQGDVVLNHFIGEHVVVEGLIIDEPDERENSTKLIVQLNSLTEPKAEIGKTGKVIVTVESHPVFSYGEEVRIEGVLQKPEGFIGDEGDYFDYASYLSKDDIFYQMFFPEIEILSEGGGNIIKRSLFTIKRAFLSNVNTVISEPASSLLGGLVVGAKRSLGEELQEDFRKTGIIHIVVLSGYNVTIVAEAIMRFFSFLPHIFGIGIGSVAIVFFAILTGASATIVRASIMALLVLLARATGRTYAITNALFIAGFFMILHNPKILVFDSSFQLSFMATLGLIYLAPKIEQYFKLVPTKWQLREFATATVATQLFVLPMILYKMGDLSLVALPVNMLILFIVPLTMLFGFITGVIGFFSTVLSIPFAFVTFLLLTYQLKVVDLFASLPFASIHINYFPLWAAVVTYVFYGLLIWKLHRRK